MVKKGNVEMNKSLFVFAPIIILSCLSSVAQPGSENDLAAIVQSKIENIRIGKIDSLPHPMQMAKQYGPALLPYLDPYLSDNNDRVREISTLMLVRIAQASSNINEKQIIANRLIKVCSKHENDAQSLLKLLLEFPACSFSTETKTLISEEFAKYYVDRSLNDHTYSQIILLVGVAEVRGEINSLKGIIKDAGDIQARNGFWWGEPAWHARRALARMGDIDEIDRCIKMVETVSDKQTKYITLFPHLAYIRHAHIVDYFLRALDKSDVIEAPCPVEGIRRTNYSLKTAILLGDMVDSFPKSIFDFPQDEEKAIENTKNWFSENPSHTLLR